MALKRKPELTFTHEVDIPVPGAAPERVEFIYKHKRRSEAKAMIESLGRGSMTDEDFARDVVAGWTKGYDGEFSAEALDELMEDYPGAPGAIVKGYINGLTFGRLGN